MDNDNIYRSSFAIPIDCKNQLRKVVAGLELTSISDFMVMLAKNPDKSILALSSIAVDYRLHSKVEEKTAKERRELRDAMIRRLKNMSLEELQAIADSNAASGQTN